MFGILLLAVGVLCFLTLMRCLKLGESLTELEQRFKNLEKAHGEMAGRLARLHKSGIPTIEKAAGSLSDTEKAPEPKPEQEAAPVEPYAASPMAQTVETPLDPTTLTSLAEMLRTADTDRENNELLITEEEWMAGTEPASLPEETSSPPPDTPVKPAAAPTMEPVPASAIGEKEKAKAKVDWEERIGKRWLTWGGVVLLAAAVGFLIKYAYEQGWIGPWTQIAIGIAAGTGLCVTGDRQVRRENLRAFGQGVLALGLALIYLTCFGAYAYFRLEQVSQATALVLLALTSFAGILLSNRHRSMPVCILASLGGYLAPALVSTGRPPPVNGLFTYTLLVNLGVIIVAMLRSWPALPLLAFAGTVTHFAGWYGKFYRPEDAVTVAVWAAVFHFTFLLLPALPLIRGATQRKWQWLLPVANAVLAVWVLWMHLRDDHPLALMLVLAAMGLGHAAIGLWNRNRQETAQVRGLYSTLGLAIITLSPLAWFGVQASLVCWLLLGLLLVETGWRFGFKPYRVFGYGNLAIGMLWCLCRLWTDTGTPLILQLTSLGLERPSASLVKFQGVETVLSGLFTLERFWTRLLTPLALAICASLLHRWREKAADANFTIKTVFAMAALLAALMFAGNDVTLWMFFKTEPYAYYRSIYVMAPLWCIAAGGVALAGMRWNRFSLAILSIPFLIPPTALTLQHLYFNNDYPVEGFFLNAGFFAKIVHALACMLSAWAVTGRYRLVAAGTAGCLLILTMHSELWSMSGSDAEWLFSLLWTGGALAYLALARLPGKRALGRCYWLPYAVALVFAVIAVYASVGESIRGTPFRNPTYFAATAAAMALFVKAAQAERHRVWLAIIAGWLLLLVNHWEIFGITYPTVARGNAIAAYWTTWRLALLWNGGALIYAALQLRFAKLRLLAGMAFPALMAAVCLAFLFLARYETASAQPFSNMFFINCLLLCAALFIGTPRARSLRVWLGLLAGWLLLLATHLEIGYWHGPWSNYAGRSVRTAWYTGLWAAGAIAFLLAAVRYQRKRIYFASLRVLSVALFCACWQYTFRPNPSYLLIINWRFITSLLSLVVLYGSCMIAARHTRDKAGNGFVYLSAAWLRHLYVFATAAGLALVTMESHQWSLAQWGDGDTGRRIAKMAVSIAWAMYSIFLLVTGFVTRVRGWRLGGLALFGATCAKLVLYDLNHLQQIHRVLAFMAVGLLLMLASYMYHRLEKRLRDGDDC